MIAPTSVSSRLRARPVTPLPKSSISLSIASARPSILATPSEHSRTVPTFCFVTDVLTPAIWASISWRRLLISNYRFVRRFKKSHLLGQLVQPRPHAAVKHIAAHLHADSANQLRVDGELHVQSGAVPVRNLFADG